MDTKCLVCGEPWDVYGVTHGDMLAWEANLFRKGAGCPCCEGETPDPEWEPKSISDVEFGDEDCIDRIYQYEDRENRPKWERPEPEVLWTCEKCGLQTLKDPDYTDTLEFNRWVYSHENLELTDKPHYTFDGERHYCSRCVDICYECGEPIEPDSDDSFHVQEGMRVYSFCSYECLDKYEIDEQIEYLGNEFSHLIKEECENPGDTIYNAYHATHDDYPVYPEKEEVIEVLLNYGVSVICLECDGSGQVCGEHQQKNLDGSFEWEKLECPACKGTGEYNEG